MSGPGGRDPEFPPTPPPTGKEMSEPPPKGKDASDKGPDKSGDRMAGLSALGIRGLSKTLTSGADSSFSISAEKHVFLAVLKDRNNMPEIGEDAVQAHLSHLSRLMAEGKIEFVGMFAGGDRRLQILLAQSREEAEQIVNSDPLMRGGYYQGFDLDEVITP